MPIPRKTPLGLPSSEASSPRLVTAPIPTPVHSPHHLLHEAMIGSVSLPTSVISAALSFLSRSPIPSSCCPTAPAPSPLAGATRKPSSPTSATVTWHISPTSTSHNIPAIATHSAMNLLCPTLRLRPQPLSPMPTYEPSSTQPLFS